MAYDLLERPEIRRVVFHPRPEFPPAPDTERHRTLRFTAGDGVTLGGRLHQAGATAPAILMFHGNGEIAADYDDLAELYRQIGATLLVVDYRGYGISGGRPAAGDLVADAVTVFEQAPALLAGQGLEPARWLVMGRSLGSAAALAAVTGSRKGPSLSGLILESGFAETLSLIERLGGRLPPEADEARDGFDSLRRIASVTVPTLIIHGEDDWIIPVDDGKRLYAASAASDKRLVIIPGAGHNDLMLVGLQTYFQAIARLLQA